MSGLIFILFINFSLKKILLSLWSISVKSVNWSTLEEETYLVDSKILENDEIDWFLYVLELAINGTKSLYQSKT